MPEKLFYGPKDVPPDALIARPGDYPFLRGIHETMYTVHGRPWTIRQFAGHGSARDTNERFHYLLGRGQAGLSTAFDLPTLYGYDSDSPISLGEVGKEGVAVDTIDDVEILFNGINLAEVSTSMTINGPAMPLTAMYFACAQNRGVQLSALRGTTQADILKEYIAQKEWIVPPKAGVKLLIDMIEYCAEHAPQWNPVSISGYHIREAGATAAQELAFTLADGIAYVEACVQRGMDVDDFAPRLSFFWDVCDGFFEEIAKMRAARVMWARIMRERFGAQNPRSWWLRAHAQTSGHSLTAEEPLNNIARVSMQALAAVFAGCQSIHTNSYDEVLSLPSEEAVTVALRTQQIILEEMGVRDVVDPLGGSYYLESLTDKITDEATGYIQRIDDMGGMVEAVENGWPQSEIADAAGEYQRAFERKEIIKVGVNGYREENSGASTVQPFRVPNIETDQVASLAGVKRRRSEREVNAALRKIERDARADANCMPAVHRAVAAHATVQEVCDVFREVYGEYTEAAVI